MFSEHSNGRKWDGRASTRDGRGLREKGRKLHAKEMCLLLETLLVCGISMTSLGFILLN